MEQEEYLKIIEDWKLEHKKEIESGKVRKVFLECLPKKGRLIDWTNIYNQEVNFICNNIEGILLILNCFRKDGRSYLNIEYNGKIFITEVGNFKAYKIKDIVNPRNYEYIYNVGDIIEDEKGKGIITKQIRMGKRNYRGYEIKCTDCNNIYERTEWHLENDLGCSCPLCGDNISVPNKMMFSILSQVLNENFLREYSPDWIGNRFYDFYFKLNNNNYIVEMDGYFHTNDNLMNNKSAKESKDIDDYKDKMAKEHNINVIRIDCDYKNQEKFDYIKNNIIKSELSKILNLSNINWLKTKELAYSNLIKVACELWNSGVHSTKEIEKIIKIERSSICKWLKQGAELNWCDYNFETAMSVAQDKIRIQTIKRCSVKIICIENGIIFNSISECERQSEEILGIKINHANIIKVLKGERNHTGGYHFKYLQDLTEEEIKEIQLNAK